MRLVLTPRPELSFMAWSEVIHKTVLCHVFAQRMEAVVARIADHWSRQTRSRGSCYTLLQPRSERTPDRALITLLSQAARVDSRIPSTRSHL